MIVVVFDGFQSLDAFGPIEVFTGAGYDVQVAAIEAGPVRASNGMTLLIDSALSDISGPIDTLVVSGGEGHRCQLLFLFHRCRSHWDFNIQYNYGRES